MTETERSLDIGRKLRAARREESLSLRELAARAEVSASLLSQIETGKANPSVRSLHSIAEALDLPIHYFFPDEASEDEDGIDGQNIGKSSAPHQAGEASLVQRLLDDLATDPEDAKTSGSEPGRAEKTGDRAAPQTGPIVRHGQHQTIELEGGVVWARLTPHKEKNAEYLLIRYEVGAQSGTRLSHHTGREFTYVLSGTLRLDLGFEQYILEAGDSMIFDSTTPHRLVNVGNTPMLAVTVIIEREGETR